jgi:cytochrome c oxidase assembly protein subunit 15
MTACGQKLHLDVNVSLARIEDPAARGYSGGVNASAQPLAQVRGAVLSRLAFQRLALANVAFLVLIVATGATVRLTGSGLGCRHWPGCEPGDLLPAQGYHSYVEFGNRVVAAITIFVTLATFGGALLARLSGRLRWLAFATFLGTLLQAPLGAITVYYHLNPYLVLTHFLLSLVVLTLGVWLWVEVAARPLVAVPRWVAAGGALVWASACVLVVSGTLATASGPHPGSVVVRRLWSFQPAVYWHVRATAVFGVSFAVALVWLWRNRMAPHVRAALVVLGLLAAQMTVGEIQYRTQLPWWLVLVHVTLAACVWAAVSTFAIRLWRPRAAN